MKLLLKMADGEEQPGRVAEEFLAMVQSWRTITDNLKDKILEQEQYMKILQDRITDQSRLRDDKIREQELTIKQLREQVAELHRARMEDRRGNIGNK